MRTGSLIALIGVSALGLSGCASVQKAGDVTASAVASTSDNSTTSVSTDSPTGSDTGTSTGQSNTTGGTSYVSNDSAFSIDGTAKTEIAIANPGGGINVETATVSVNTNLTGMTWVDTIEMALFKTGITGVATDGLDQNQDFYNTPGVNPNFTGYKQYHKIIGGADGTTTTDAELQIWSYQFSNIGKYTVWNDPSAANNNNVSLFFDGSATPTTALPAGSATYRGKFGGIGVASNWLSPTRTVDDPFDTADTAGKTYDPNGTWRVVGDTTVVADFGAGTVNGTINNMTWRKFTGSETSPDGFITITPGETAKPFSNYTFNGTITDNTFAGNAQGQAGSVVTGNNAVNGGFFGPNGEEVAGVVSVETTSPSPTDGLTTNDANRRGFIKLDGVFQGNR